MYLCALLHICMKYGPFQEEQATPQAFCSMKHKPSIKILDSTRVSITETLRSCSNAQDFLLVRSLSVSDQVTTYRRHRWSRTSSTGHRDFHVHVHSLGICPTYAQPPLFTSIISPKNLTLTIPYPKKLIPSFCTESAEVQVISMTRITTLKILQ